MQGLAIDSKQPERSIIQRRLDVPNETENSRRRLLPDVKVVYSLMNGIRVCLFASLALCSTSAFAQTAPASSAAASPAAATAVIPRFVTVVCAQPFAKEDKAECGMLTVAENRSNSKTRAIRLPVVIFRSRAATPPRDAVLFMTGGPGGSSVANLHSSRDIIFVQDRDYVVLEQRGARKAEPALECAEITPPKIEINAGRLKGTEATRALADAARTCRNRLAAEGADLSGYTSAATAADVEDLRRALGYEKWDLYGISYSTRLMLTVARDFPGSVRSMVLDSVLPLEVNFDDVSAANLMRSLNLVFDGCAVTAECARDHGDIRKKFFELVERADLSPLPLPISAAEAGGKSAHIGGSEVVNAVYNGLHSVSIIPKLPGIIDEASKGHYGVLTELVKQNLGAPGYAWGLRYSVWCGEEFPFENRDAMAAQVSPALGLGGINLGTLPPAVCDAWNVPAAPAKEDQPVTSGAPTLIFAGEFDPDTPPAWGQQLIGPLSHAYFVEFRGRSHTPGFFRCGQQMAAEFFRDPGKAPAMDCVLTMRGADFADMPTSGKPQS
jgi:pimeloyl-ACP methyl ester carboxylesterase